MDVLTARLEKLTLAKCANPACATAGLWPDDLGYPRNKVRLFTMQQARCGGVALLSPHLTQEQNILVDISSKLGV
jgi:hypothetical protein